MRLGCPLLEHHIQLTRPSHESCVHVGTGQPVHGWQVLDVFTLVGGYIYMPIPP